MASLLEKVENDTRRYLKRIFFTMVLCLGWMFANVVFGLGMELGYVEGKWTAGNMLYYAGSLLALVLLIVWLVRTWSKPMNPEKGNEPGN
ncbi:MAG: hypothetical protein JNM68_06830 [Dinghuibacter sp.]|nr:hypothetical protein [Dinghuibacter sp.]